MDLKNKEYLKCVDGLKGVAAFVVAFIWHYQHFSPKENPFSFIFNLTYDVGWSMVDLFFILSGFGMMLGYGKKIFNRQISFKDYIIKRIKKLYPVFLFSTILVFLLELIFKYKTGYTFVYENFDINHLIQNLLFIQYGFFGKEYSFNGPSWAISICIACYCLFYFIVYRVKKYNHIIYVYSVLAIIGAAIIAAGLRYPILNDAIGRGISGFSVGVLVEMVYERRELFQSKKLGYCCLFFLICTYIVMRFVSKDYSGDFALAMLLGLGPMIVMSTLFISWQKIFMGNIVFSYLGKISLEIYLFHFPVQCIFKNIEVYLGLELDTSKEWFWICYVLITIGVASLYHFVISRWVERFVVIFFAKRKKGALD